MILGRRIALLNKGSNHFMAVANDGHLGHKSFMIVWKI